MWWWEITISSGHSSYAHNPLPLGTRIVNIPMIWKAAQFGADYANVLYKHTQDNSQGIFRDKTRGKKSIFFLLPLLHHQIYSVTDHHSWFSYVSVFCSVRQTFLKYQVSAIHRTTCWRSKDEQDALPELMVGGSLNELVRETFVIPIFPL